MGSYHSQGTFKQLWKSIILNTITWHWFDDVTGVLQCKRVLFGANISMEETCKRKKRVIFEWDDVKSKSSGKREKGRNH
jgi:hypothetical protein